MVVASSWQPAKKEPQKLSLVPHVAKCHRSFHMVKKIITFGYSVLTVLETIVGDDDRGIAFPKYTRMSFSL